jgi:hypothetical protein
MNSFALIDLPDDVYLSRLFYLSKLIDVTGFKLFGIGLINYESVVVNVEFCSGLSE